MIVGETQRIYPTAPAARDILQRGFVRLRFPEAWESLFLDHYVERYFPHTRLGMGVIVLVYGAWAVLDPFFFPDQPGLMVAARAFIAAMFLMTFLATVLLPGGRRFYERLLVAVATIYFGGSLVLFLAAGTEEHRWLMYAALLMGIMFASSYIRLRFSGVFWSQAFIAVAFPVLTPIFLDAQAGTMMMAMALVVTACVLSTGIAYHLEHTARWSYLQAVALEQERQKLDEEIVERKRISEELHRLATTDSLTGLFNRRHFLELSAQESQRMRRYQQPMTVLLIDADRFKKINDTWGHAAGDEVLRRLAEICRLKLRGFDVIGRLGGEEFAVTLPQTDQQHAAVVADRLRQALSETEVKCAQTTLKFTVSIGLAQRKADGEEIDDLLHRADVAVYKAKENGRNRVEVG